MMFSISSFPNMDCTIYVLLPIVYTSTLSIVITLLAFGHKNNTAFGGAFVLSSIIDNK